MSRVRVYLGCSLDGFIAGPGDDLSFLDVPPPDEDGDALGFTAFMDEIGAMVMGRRTYDIVTAMGVDWPYGDTPVFVATHRPLDPVVPTVSAVSGDLGAILAAAADVAADRDVYLDGGALVRQGLDAGCVDELCITWVPTLLGAGISLFDGVRPTDVEIVSHHRLGTMLQVVLRPTR